MFEIIGAFTVTYLVLGIFVISFLYTCDARGMRDAITSPIKDRRWGEVAFIVVFSLWCWPMPLIEFLSER